MNTSPTMFYAQQDGNTSYRLCSKFPTPFTWYSSFLPLSFLLWKSIVYQSFGENRIDYWLKMRYIGYISFYTSTSPVCDVFLFLCTTLYHSMQCSSVSQFSRCLSFLFVVFLEQLPYSFDTNELCTNLYLPYIHKQEKSKKGNKVKAEKKRNRTSVAIWAILTL